MVNALHNVQHKFTTLQEHTRTHHLIKIYLNTFGCVLDVCFSFLMLFTCILYIIYVIKFLELTLILVVCSVEFVDGDKIRVKPNTCSCPLFCGVCGRG